MSQYMEYRTHSTRTGLWDLHGFTWRLFHFAQQTPQSTCPNLGQCWQLKAGLLTSSCIFIMKRSSTEQLYKLCLAHFPTAAVYSTTQRISRNIRLPEREHTRILKSACLTLQHRYFLKVNFGQLNCFHLKQSSCNQNVLLVAENWKPLLSRCVLCSKAHLLFPEKARADTWTDNTVSKWFNLG